MAAVVSLLVPWAGLTIARIAQVGGDGSAPFPVWEYGLAGACLVAVAVFANRSIDRERAQHDVILTSLRAEMVAERERHEKEAARIVAQRDSMIQDFTSKALPVLIRVTDVLEKRQAIDEQVVAVVRENTQALVEVRRHGAEPA